MYPSAQLAPPTQPTKRSGFTLVELLMVITVILILVGLTFGISRGVQNAQARTKAKAELAMIAQALEQFKSTYGDYPWVAGTPTSDANAEALFLALTGWSVLKKENGTVSMVPVSDGQKKEFLDPTKMTLSEDYDDPSVPGDLDGVFFMDPWGSKYAYLYDRGSAGWDNFGYVLFSEGPDRDHAAPGSDGVLTQAVREDPDNIDNIYAGE